MNFGSRSKKSPAVSRDEKTAAAGSVMLPGMWCGALELPGERCRRTAGAMRSAFRVKGMPAKRRLAERRKQKAKPRMKSRKLAA